MFKAIILDFDGVILESLDIKTRAFLKVYHDYPEYADEIARYHLQNVGVSRYKKFVHINSNIIGIPITDSEIEEMAKTFSEAVVDEMLKCPFVDGALEFLDKYSVIAGLYVASGTPQDELCLIVQKRGLTKYFSGVFGTPASKPQIIQEILAIDSIRNDEAVFVGDAMSDYNGAKDADVPFIARINNQTPDNPFLDMDIPSVNDLEELDLLLERGL